MPMALRYGLSAYLNEVILFTKGTAIVGAITVTDVMAVANEAVSTTFDPVTPLVMAALIYWSLVQILRMGFTRLEAHLNQYLALDDGRQKTEIGTSV
jgi:ABC-type arginine/histidine transport system permease subunit